MQCLGDFWRAFHNFTPGLTMTESLRRFNALDNPVEDYNHVQNINTLAKTGIDFPGDYLMHFFKYLSPGVGRSRQNALTLQPNIYLSPY